MDFQERVNQLTELASYDDSEMYEVDKGGIYWDANLNKFCYITASGCSCWDGEYNEDLYDSLIELLEAEKVSETSYRPSLSTFERMAGESMIEAVKLGLFQAKKPDFIGLST